MQLVRRDPSSQPHLSLSVDVFDRSVGSVYAHYVSVTAVRSVFELRWFLLVSLNSEHLLSFILEFGAQNKTSGRSQIIQHSFFFFAFLYASVECLPSTVACFQLLQGFIYRVYTHTHRLYVHIQSQK